ncbi:unnamed protein product, partial [Polarella glacialis]
MLQRGPVPDAFSFNSAMDACKSLAGSDHCTSWPWALWLLRELRQSRRIKPDVVTFNTAASACERGSFWAGALALLTEMRSLNLPSTPISYKTVMAACERASEWRVALAVLEAMHQHGHQLEFTGYRAALLAVCASGRVDEGLALFRGMAQEGLVQLWQISERFAVDLHGLPTEVARLAVFAALFDMAEQ